MKMLDSQPAWMLKAKDETNNVEAVRRLIAKAPRPTRLLEYFGGLGGVTRIALETFPGTPIQTWDADKTCVECLRAIEGIEVKQGDSLSKAEPKKGDGILMDFNLWTLLRAKTKYRGVMRQVFGSGAKWVQVADSSSAKLHINFRSYGCLSSDWDEYVGQVKGWAMGMGWALVGQERSHFKTVMFLFRPLTKIPPKSGG